MNKNKFGVETKWSLQRITLENNWGHVYFWVDENNVIQFKREINPIGFLLLTDDNFIGVKFSELHFSKKYKLKKIESHKMNQEELEKGWLLL